MSAKQIKKSLISIADELFDLFKVQGFFREIPQKTCTWRANALLAKQTFQWMRPPKSSILAEKAFEKRFFTNADGVSAFVQ